MTGGNPGSLRLSASDRLFLNDLARVHIVSQDLADKHHYAHLKGGAQRPLARLEQAGLVHSKLLHVPGRHSLRTYEFANEAVAKAWGGKLPVTGAKRTDLHELITSRLYYELDRPSDFRVASNFSATDVATCGSCRPDAMYTDPGTGELVMVEADSGHYSKQQINHKVARWQSLGLTRQVWGQPHYAAAHVPAVAGVSVLRF